VVVCLTVGGEVKPIGSSTAMSRWCWWYS